MRLAALRAPLVVVTLALQAACGLFADAVSNATAQNIETELFPSTALGGPAVQPLTFEATASDGSPSYSVPDDLDTHDWGPIIAAHNAALDRGDNVGTFQLNVASFALTSAQNLQFHIVVSSRDGLVFPPANGGSDEDPASCTFVVASSSDGSTLGARIGGCLSDWVRANGIPNMLDYTVSINPTTQPGQQLAGVPFAITHTETLVAKRALEQACFSRAIKIPGGVLDNLQYVKLEDLGVEGEASASVDVEMAAFAYVYPYDTSPVPVDVTHVSMGTDMPANQTLSYVFDDNHEKKNDFNAEFSPAMGGWMYDTLNAAIAVAQGNRANHTNVAGVWGCYTVYGAAPRTGNIKFTLTGTAKFSTEAH
jgi:hypothetical protein